MIVSATCYYPDPKQTDDTPYTTSNGSEIDKDSPGKHRWIAVSRDILAKYGYGAVVCISNAGRYDGVWYIADVMNKRFTSKIDFLVSDNDYIARWKMVDMYLIAYGDVDRV